jgi:L-fuconolactonase
VSLDDLLPLVAGIEALPDGRYIIDHLGRPPIGQDATAQRLWHIAMTRLAQLPNVYVKFSGWATNVGRAVAADVLMYGNHVLATFGPSRTIYASNWPVALVAADYRNTLTATLEALRPFTHRTGRRPGQHGPGMLPTARRCEAVR